MSVKIYFAAPITGGRDGSEWYPSLVDILKQYGQVLTEHIANKDLTNFGENLAPATIHDRDIDWLFQSDALVVEATEISHGVGYEVGRFVERNDQFSKTSNQMVKPVLILYRPTDTKKVTSMFTGIPKHLGVTVDGYTSVDEARDKISQFMDKHGFDNIGWF